MGMHTFKNVQEAEDYLTDKYKGKYVTFSYFHPYKQKFISKTEKVDRVVIDDVKDLVILFFIDGTKNEFHKNELVHEVKLTT